MSLDKAILHGKEQRKPYEEAFADLMQYIRAGRIKALSFEEQLKC